MNADLLRAIVLKVMFKPEPIRRAEAALLYVGLAGEVFSADVIPGEVCNDNTTAGCAVGALATMGLIERVDRVKSPSKSRNGAYVSRWKLADGRRFTALCWLEKNGFPLDTIPKQQTELAI